jgi:hypothetical protein
MEDGVFSMHIINLPVFSICNTGPSGKIQRIELPKLTFSTKVVAAEVKPATSGV